MAGPAAAPPRRPSSCRGGPSGHRQLGTPGGRRGPQLRVTRQIRTSPMPAFPCVRIRNRYNRTTLKIKASQAACLAGVAPRPTKSSRATRPGERERRAGALGGAPASRRGRSAGTGGVPAAAATMAAAPEVQLCKRSAGVAQLVEQLIRNERVGGSSPLTGFRFAPSRVRFRSAGTGKVPASCRLFPIKREDRKEVQRTVR